jgi:hypothetical protein
MHAAVFEALRSDQPAAMVIQDVQWTDESTREYEQLPSPSPSRRTARAPSFPRTTSLRYRDPCQAAAASRLPDAPSRARLQQSGRPLSWGSRKTTLGSLAPASVRKQASAQ